MGWQNVSSIPDTLNLDLMDEDLHPCIIFAFMTAKYGNDWVRWEPETIKDELKISDDDDSRSLNYNKILALAASLVSMEPYTQWHIYEKVATVFNNFYPLFCTVQPLSPGMVMVANDILSMLCDKIGSQFGLSEEVWRYIAAVFEDNDFHALPEKLQCIRPCMLAFNAVVKPDKIYQRRNEIAAGSVPNDNVELDRQALLLLAADDMVKISNNNLKEQETKYFGGGG